MRYREGRGVVETGPFLKSSEASITVFMRVRQFEPHLKKSLQKLAIIQERFDRDFLLKRFQLLCYIFYLTLTLAGSEIVYAGGMAGADRPHISAPNH